jgi:hypothetical protein
MDFQRIGRPIVAGAQQLFGKRDINDNVAMNEVGRGGP